MNINEEYELYDLSNDFAETKNVAKEHSEIVERLSRIMQSEHVTSKNWPID
jgi:hypothetical protein